MTDDITPDEVTTIMTDPGEVGRMFCQALRHPSENATALRWLVTPESLNLWGDFSEEARILASIDNYGIVETKPSIGDPTVAYSRILRLVDDAPAMVQASYGRALTSWIVTLVWRAEYGRWMVHHFGDFVLPENVPHGQPPTSAAN